MTVPFKTRITDLYGIRLPIVASGLMWLAAMILGGLGALIAAAFAWMLADGRQALVLLGAAAAALIALGFLSVKRIQAEIRMALARSKGG